jgi:predicted transposase/invertase (TIGR01784 family)
MDCFEAPELAHELWLKPYPLIDLSVIPDEELRTHQSVALLELIQKHIHTRDMLEFVQDITYYLNQDQACPERVDALLRYIVQEGECSDYGMFFQTLAQQTQRYRENVMTIAQQLRQEGMQKGRQEGRQEGQQAGWEQARKAMARSMLDAQEPLEKITRYTGLSAQDIALLQTQH